MAGFILVAVAAGRAARADDAIPLINGKDLSGWKIVGKKGAESNWQFGTAALDPDDSIKLKVTGPGTDLVSPDKNVNLSSEQEFGDCTVETEFMVSKGSNSGIKLENIYEIQIYDSFGVIKPGITDCGAVYDEKAPSMNACKPPGEWQTLLIEFQAPRFDESGKKTANAKFIRVVLNGKTVQKNVEIAHGTNVSRNAKEHPTGGIYLQGDHGAVAFRNFKVTPATAQIPRDHPTNTLNNGTTTSNGINISK